MKDSKQQQLTDECILDPGGFTTEQLEQLESLSDDEVEALKSIRKKLNKFDWPFTAVVKPQML